MSFDIKHIKPGDHHHHHQDLIKFYYYNFVWSLIEMAKYFIKILIPKNSYRRKVVMVNTIITPSIFIHVLTYYLVLLCFGSSLFLCWIIFNREERILIYVVCCAIFSWWIYVLILYNEIYSWNAWISFLFIFAFETVHLILLHRENFLLSSSNPTINTMDIVVEYCIGCVKT